MQRTPVPYSAGGMFAAYDYDDNFVYVGGGYNNGATRNDLLRYDPVNNSWMPLASSPDHHTQSQAVYFKGKLYNMGGNVGDLSHVSNTTRIYDIATNTWTTGSRCPTRWVPKPPCYGIELFTSREATMAAGS